jgi:hypothetical protein
VVVLAQEVDPPGVVIIGEAGEGVRHGTKRTCGGREMRTT